MAHDFPHGCGHQRGVGSQPFPDPAGKLDHRNRDLMRGIVEFDPGHHDPAVARITGAELSGLFGGDVIRQKRVVAPGPAGRDTGIGEIDQCLETGHDPACVAGLRAWTFRTECKQRATNAASSKGAPIRER